MKKSLAAGLLFLFYLCISAEEIVTLSDGRKIVLYDDHTWAEVKTQIETTSSEIVTKYKPLLRSGIKATDAEIVRACEMLAQGWKYSMPRPKSTQAAWGNRDGRTTWWNGYWNNSKTNQYSITTPVKRDSGLYLGDNQNSANTWRNGGSPSMPDIYMFLLSDSGGPTR